MSSSNWTWRAGDYQVTRSVCWSPPGCHGGCGVRLTTQNGRLARVEGDSDNRYNRGRTCVRCSSVVEAVYHPQRLTSPLLRIGQRGENRWKRISFAEAIEIIAERFLSVKKKWGPESVIFCKGTARDIGGWLPRLCYGFGSPNYFGFGPANGNACYRPRVAVATAMLGGMPIPDFGQFDDFNSALKHQPPKCILIWGSNPVYSNPDGLYGGWVTDAMKKGAELIVVDPQKTWLASKAKHWLQIRPGSDGALALAFLHVLFAEDLIDHGFCAAQVLGTEEVKSAARNYAPEYAASLTDVPAEALRAAARFWARSKPANAIWGVGIDMHAGCLGTIQGLIGLMALTGNVGNPGGMLLPGDPFGVKRRGDDISDFPNIKTKRIGAEQYPLLEIGNPYAQPDVLLNQMESTEPYPIKAAWLQGTGVVPASFADPQRVLRLFKQLDFTVVVDVFMTPAAVALADIVLPAAMYPEKDGLFVQAAQVGAINKVVDPPGECKSDAEIILALGKRITPEYFPWETSQEWMDDRLRPAHLSFADLRHIGSLTPLAPYAKNTLSFSGKSGTMRFSTPSGKIELKSSVLQELGLNPLPHYENHLARYQRDHSSESYPFILTTGARRPYFFCSEHRQIDSLRRLQPQPAVTIHPADAERLGVVNGDAARISSPYGECVMQALVRDQFAVGVIHADYGWWFPEKPAAEPELFGVHRANVNALFPSNLQGPGGFGYPFRGFICNIRKI